MSNVSGDRGKRHERDMARRCTEQVPGDVITTRDGRGGAQGGLDLLHILPDGTRLDTVLGWAVECKALQSDPTVGTFDKWWRQVNDDAPAGSRPVVLFRRVGAHDGWAQFEDVDVGWRLVPLSRWFETLFTMEYET